MKENCLWGRCKKIVKKKTNTSTFSATHIYIKRTLVGFFFTFFYAPFPKTNTSEQHFARPFQGYPAWHAQICTKNAYLGANLSTLNCWWLSLFDHQRERWLVDCGFISRLKSDINAFYVDCLLFRCIDKEKGKLLTLSYRVVFLLVCPKKWVSLHVDPFRKVLSVRIS